jgi:hypothetical protein
LISTSSKYVVGVKATAGLFIASVSKQNPSAHFMPMRAVICQTWILRKRRRVMRRRAMRREMRKMSRFQTKTWSTV